MISIGTGEPYRDMIEKGERMTGLEWMCKLDDLMFDLEVTTNAFFAQHFTEKPSEYYRFQTITEETEEHELRDLGGIDIDFL